MSLIDFSVELHRTNDLLERIATALERLNPPIPLDQLQQTKRGPEAIISYGDDSRSWMSERVQNVIHEQGLAPAEEQELLNQAMNELNELGDN